MESINRSYSLILTPGLLVCMMFLGILESGAQTFAEWFAQKKTQERYLVEQISALELYGSYLKKGYKLVSSGLGLVKDLSHREFKLHDDFFASLKSINPSLGLSVKAAELAAAQVEILNIFKHLKREESFYPLQKQHLNVVADMLKESCLEILQEALMLLTKGDLSLNDQERSTRFERLRAQMQDRLTFTMDFAGQMMRFNKLKKGQQHSIIELRRWYEN